MTDKNMVIRIYLHIKNDILKKLQINMLCLMDLCKCKLNAIRTTASDKL